MTRTFEPAIVAATELDEDCFAVVFAEYPDGDGEHIALMRAHSFDEQDRRLGQDTYCVTINGTVTRYGGVTSWSIVDDVLELDFDREASAVFETKTLEIVLPKTRPHDLSEALQRVFAMAPRANY